MQRPHRRIYDILKRILLKKYFITLSENIKKWSFPTNEMAADVDTGCPTDGTKPWFSGCEYACQFSKCAAGKIIMLSTYEARFDWYLCLQARSIPRKRSRSTWERITDCPSKITSGHLAAWKPRLNGSGAKSVERQSKETMVPSAPTWKDTSWLCKNTLKSMVLSGVTAANVCSQRPPRLEVRYFYWFNRIFSW